MHRLLEQLVTQMVEKGIHYEDALREFDRRFIVEVVEKSDGNLSKAADTLGVPPQYAVAARSRTSRSRPARLHSAAAY